MNGLLLAEQQAFGLRHICMLIVSVAIIVCMVFFLRNAELKTWYKILLFVGIFSETTKLLFYIVANEETYGGYLPKTDLPFQLCSIQLIFIALLNFSKNEKLHRILLSFMLPTCLIGGLMAMLIPTYSAKNDWIITIQYFIYHSAIMAFAIHILIDKKMNWEIKDLFTALKFLAFMGLIAIYINSICYDVVEYANVDGVKTVEYVSRVNFMYIIDPPASGLPILNKDHGWLVYFVHFAVVAVIFVCLTYIVPIIKKIKSLKK